MIKKVFSDKLSRQLIYKHHVVVRSFGRAKTMYGRLHQADRETFPLNKKASEKIPKSFCLNKYFYLIYLVYFIT